METRWMCVHYRDKAFDYPVYDVDKMLVMDLMMNFEDHSVKQDVRIPKVYDMFYKGRNRDWKTKITCDSGLVSMFDECFGMETIDLWLEDTDNPIKEFELASELKRKQRELEEAKKREEEERVRLEREADEAVGIGRPIRIGYPVVDLDTNETEYAYVQLQDEHFTEPEAKEPPSVAQQSETSSENEAGRPNQPSETCTTNDKFSKELQSSSSKMKTRKKRALKEIPSNVKIPKTTARRKGAYVPKSQQPAVPEPGEISAGRAKRKAAVAVSTNMELVSSSESKSEDEDFVLSGGEVKSVWDVDGSDTELEAACGKLLPFHDALERVSGDNVDEQDPMDRLHQGGRVYVPQRWGKINIGVRNIFLSKSHFLEVFTDYCIQEGFSVVVEKSDPVRYTAECIGKQCTWRIHTSKLPGSILWAVKTISGIHVDCFRSQRNTMATSDWMCKKLQDELKAHPKMPVKAMQTLLKAKFGIDTCRRTMYKVRDMAVKKTIGGYEESYDLAASYPNSAKLAALQ